MQGPTIKTYFAKKMGIDPQSIVNVALTPCTAKKFEIRREEMNAAGRYLGIEGMRDMDYVITTRELAAWAREEQIDFPSLEEGRYDPLMSEASGAGVIFGNTGGVMEAALRTAYSYVTGEPAPEKLYDLTPVRGMDGFREASVKIGDLDLRVAVIYGTANVRKFLDRQKTDPKDYAFVEVMTCPGGCIGGGGQPKGTQEKGNALLRERIDGLYARDASMAKSRRASHENKEILEGVRCSGRMRENSSTIRICGRRKMWVLSLQRSLRRSWRGGFSRMLVAGGSRRSGSINARSAGKWSSARSRLPAARSVIRAVRLSWISRSR